MQSSNHAAHTCVLNSMETYIHPLDAGLLEIGQPVSGLAFPPAGWHVIGDWGAGYALGNHDGLRLIIDCSQKDDDRWWIHISVSRAKRTPSHEDMAAAKRAFLGDRYAYAVYPPRAQYVNIHPNCLHLWSLIDDRDGRILPEFSAELNIGLSI